MVRKLRIRIEWGFTGVSDDEDDHDLPDEWDELAESEQDAIIKSCIETIVFNQVGTSGEVVEVDE